MVKPETILARYRRPAAQKLDGSKYRNAIGRPSVSTGSAGILGDNIVLARMIAPFRAQRGTLAEEFFRDAVEAAAIEA